MNKIHKGDEVIVIAGKDKGKRGVVTLRKDESKVVVEGLNMVKRHVKPNPMKNEVGGVITRSMAIHQSNLAIFNASTGKADRVGVKKVEVDGKERNVRIYKSTGEEIKMSWSKS